MYIAVHGGAGMHSPSREKEIKHALRLACREALIKTMNQDGSSCAPLDAVGDAIALLEDASHLNAGYGSNLTLDGTVECDAAIMDSHSNFGSVGAVSGVKNPIRLARAILDYSKIPDSLGRIPPLTLVSSGAHSFALAQAPGVVDIVPPESMISPKSKDIWTKWKARLNGDIHPDDTKSASLTDIQDTVGAVAFRNGDSVAAGVSSGGILLKYPGRLGEVCIVLIRKENVPTDKKATVFGAGCWAQEFPKAGIKIACSLSGAGEHIVRCALAREIGDSFSLAIAKEVDIDAHDILYSVLLEKFCIPCKKRGVVAPDVGVLLLMAEETDGKPNVRLWCAFTTPSMAVAYAYTSPDNLKPHAEVLRRPHAVNTTAPNADESHIFITAIPLR